MTLEEKMATEIFLRPDELWDYFYAHTTEFKKPLFLARSSDGLFEIYASDNDFGEIEIYVLANGEVIDEETVVDKFDCEGILAVLYSDYIYDGVEEILEQKDMIDERETAIDVAIVDFLETLAPSVLDDTKCDDIIADLIDVIGMRLYYEHGISMYRPMFIQDEDGTTEFCEFPYEEIDIEI